MLLGLRIIVAKAMERWSRNLSAMPSPPRLAASGRAIGDAQRDRRTCSPDTHTFALVDHHDELAASGMPQGLNHLEDDRVAQGRIRGIELAGAHDPLGEFSRGQLTVLPQLLGAQIRNLTLLEEAVTDHIASPLLLDIRE